jgi:hypothetical protein
MRCRDAHLSPIAIASTLAETSGIGELSSLGGALPLSALAPCNSGLVICLSSSSGPGVLDLAVVALFRVPALRE